jgi:hypothetical protein
MDAFHVSDAAISRINLDLRRNSGKCKPGTWKRRDVDLNRNGRGGVEDIVYATMLLTAVSIYCHGEWRPTNLG